MVWSWVSDTFRSGSMTRIALQTSWCWSLQLLYSLVRPWAPISLLNHLAERKADCVENEWCADKDLRHDSETPKQMMTASPEFKLTSINNLDGATLITTVTFECSSSVSTRHQCSHGKKWSGIFALFCVSLLRTESRFSVHYGLSCLQ